MRTVVTGLAAFGLLGAGFFSAVGSPAAQASTVPPLVLGQQDGSPGYVDNFNPFSPTSLVGWEWVYEPMYVVDTLTGTQHPWLATSYKWVNAKTLTFTIRSGVKWSNGKAFTAQDVAFTFNLIKDNPAIDTKGLFGSTGFLNSVTASGNTVTFNFSHANVPGWTYIATQPIVYPGQFTGVNVSKFTDTNPIGTGPFTVSKFSSAQYTLARNPNYWQASKVKIPAVKEIALSNNITSDLLLSDGTFDEAVLFEPGIQQAYVSKNPKYYHYWFPLASPVSLYFNLTKPPFNMLAFRQAVAYALNRSKIFKNGEYGYEPPANQSMLPPTLQQSGWLDKSLLKKYPYNYDPSKAKAILKHAGFKLKGGQLYTPKGKPVSFTLEVPAGWTDYIADMGIIKSELGALGMKVTTETPVLNTDYNDVETGHFQAAIVYGWTEANPYFVYYNILDKATSAPIGQVTGFNSNSERWNNPLTNRLLYQLASATTSAQQHKIVDEIQQQTFTQLPVITMVYAAAWNEYQTNHYVGWPTQSNPYADPSVTYPDTLLLATHVHPIK
jgi:peptide/nickel transport system substrate-binding protein